MYFVGLPEREKKVYSTRVEALRRRFGQETDTSIALQELAGLRRGKNQSAKELADSARRLASQAALHAFQMAVGEDLQLKCAEQSCRTLEMAVEIQERYTKKALQKRGRRWKADMECHSCHQKGHFARECPTNATEGRSGNGQSPPSQ